MQVIATGPRERFIHFNRYYFSFIAYRYPFKSLDYFRRNTGSGIGEGTEGGGDVTLLARRGYFQYTAVGGIK